MSDAPDAAPTRHTHRSARGAVALVAVLLVAHAVLAGLSVSRQSPTFDEPLGVASAIAATWDGDYRIDYEHPPLWKYWAALPNAGTNTRGAAVAQAGAELSTNPMAKWGWTEALLFRGGNDGLRSVARSRAMMLAGSVFLGILIAAWTWRLGGPVAAVFATAFFAFDPNFLAHGPLVKNDVPVALASVAVVAATWALGRRLTVGRVIALGIVCGAAVTTKLSALLLAPIVVLLVLGRALLPGAWEAALGPRRRNSLVSIPAKLAAAGVTVLIVAVVAYGVVWAVYRLRYSATPDGRASIDVGQIVRIEALRAFYANDPDRRPSEEELAAWDPGRTARALLFARDHRLLPEAFLAGLLFTGRTALGEWTYVLGEKSFGAPWYYFPVAILVKTPLATLVGVGAGVLFLVWKARSQRAFRDPELRWTILCLAIVPVVLLGVAIASPMGLGIRYLLPAYPFAFIGIGLAAHKVWKDNRGVNRAVPVLLVLALVAETVAAFPHYIPFFNLASGGARGGFALLGDSNLDWGQDLPLLAQWQRDHADEDLYLAYFGTTPPEAYGIRYHPMAGGYTGGRPAEVPRSRCVIAISATKLQGIYERSDPHAAFRDSRPLEVLGGSIYLFRFDPAASGVAR
jgi:hypothetical protein